MQEEVPFMHVYPFHILTPNPIPAPTPLIGIMAIPCIRAFVHPSRLVLLMRSAVRKSHNSTCCIFELLPFVHFIKLFCIQRVKK